MGGGGIGGGGHGGDGLGSGGFDEDMAARASGAELSTCLSDLVAAGGVVPCWLERFSAFEAAFFTSLKLVSPQSACCARRA
jgi:hypothetical protein